MLEQNCVFCATKAAKAIPDQMRPLVTFDLFDALLLLLERLH